MASCHSPTPLSPLRSPLRSPIRSPIHSTRSKHHGFSTPLSPPASGSPTSIQSPDRFIPCRKSLDVDFANYSLVSDNSRCSDVEDHGLQSYKNTLRQTLFDDKDTRNVFCTSLRSPISGSSAASPSTSLSRQTSLRGVYQQNKRRNFQKPQIRNIPSKEERILDAPGMLDDFYLHLLSWSAANLLAVALQNNIYIWNADTGSAHHLCGLGDDPPQRYYSSLEWSTQDSNLLALSSGPPENEIELWNATTGTQAMSLHGQAHRIGALAWNGHLLASGARDGTILLHDTRSRSRVASITPHMGEVCGLSWAPDGTQLASGGNDNIVNIWDAGKTTPKFAKTEHQAAVKAMAWCPWQSSLLATGGGTADRHIRFWNTSNGQCVNAVDTKSQVCSLVWSKDYKELVSSHGYSENQLIVWKYPTMEKVTELTGHTARVLHLALTPDGETVISAAADETIRFWRCFESSKKAKSSPMEYGSSSFSSGLNIR